MRRLLGAVLCASACLAGAAEPETHGLAPLESVGDGATVILSGLLTRESFKLEKMRVVGARPAGRAADPDQFRLRLLDVNENELGVIRTWSPLTTFVWHQEREQHVAEYEPERLVNIAVPATISLETVELRFTDGKDIARVRVGPHIREFCKERPENPACSAAWATISPGSDKSD